MVTKYIPSQGFRIIYVSAKCPFVKQTRVWTFQGTSVLQDDKDDYPQWENDYLLYGEEKKGGADGEDGDDNDDEDIDEDTPTMTIMPTVTVKVIMTMIRTVAMKMMTIMLTVVVVVVVSSILS